MIFDLKDRNSVNVKLLRQFDGKYNYFNPTSNGSMILYRYEHKFKNKILVSDIVSSDGRIILQNYQDEFFHYSYEDPRFINNSEISVNVCKRDRNDLAKTINVTVMLYDIYTKKFRSFITQNAHFEKHWQFQNDTIIYHIKPYTLLNSDESILYQKDLNWQYWIDRFGWPCLSTNIFRVNDENFIIFHSKIDMGWSQLKYYIGILKLDDQLHPLGYASTPLFISNREYTDNNLLNDMWLWRLVECHTVIKCEVIFPMTVIPDDIYLNIYSGLNDCSAVNIQIDKNVFINKIKDIPFIIY
jgi:hypothetical protein